MTENLAASSNDLRESVEVSYGNTGKCGTHFWEADFKIWTICSEFRGKEQA